MPLPLFPKRRNPYHFWRSVPGGDINQISSVILNASERHSFDTHPKEFVILLFSKCNSGITRFGVKLVNFNTIETRSAAVRIPGTYPKLKTHGLFFHLFIALGCRFSFENREDAWGGP